MRLADGESSVRRTLVAGLLSCLVFGLVGSLVTLIRPATYRSTAVITIDQPGALISDADAGSIGKLVKLRELYGPLLRTSEAVDPVAQVTGLRAQQVVDRVSVVVAPDSLLLVVRATGDSARSAHRLAAAAAQELISYTADVQSRAGVDPKLAVVLSLVSPAEDGVVTSGGMRTVLTVGLMLGLLGGLVGAVVVAWRGQDLS